MARGRRFAELALNDDVRVGIPMALATVATLIAVYATSHLPRAERVNATILVACTALTLQFLVYLIWTHALFTGMGAARARQVARAQFDQERSGWARVFSFGSPEGWAVTAVLIAFVGSLAASIYGLRGGGVALTVAALLMAATAWAMVVYTYALRYFRIHCAGGLFTFDFDDEPVFGDFLTMSLTVSAAGAHVVATPTSRIGVNAMRSHTVIAFVFNALVIAVTVSLISTVVAVA